MHKRKLIEVALPLEAINRESAREKSIRHGHPSTLHLWWARRPLAAARAVLFAQLVDDPSSHPARFPTEDDQRAERERLHGIIERLVVWENVRDEKLLAEAHREILASCDGIPPSILDPFAGGGTIPLEAQRLGLEAHASDLNPVAVLINKALIEIPPKFRDQPPVFPGLADSEIRTWKGAEGLAADVRAYGQWMRDEADKRIGHLYPKATLPDGSLATVIAWIWARTVPCPNPACGIDMPLVTSWWLGKKKGKEAYVVPSIVADSTRVSGRRVKFDVRHDLRAAPPAATTGTVGRSGATCVACEASVSLKYIRNAGSTGRLGANLLSVVAETARKRHYLNPSEEQQAAADIARPSGPDMVLSTHPQYMGAPRYGMRTAADLFTNRQLATFNTLVDIVGEAEKRVRVDMSLAGSRDDWALREYSNAIQVYLSFVVSKALARNNTMCTWESGMNRLRGSFQRQAYPMTWDYAEANPLTKSGGGLLAVVESEAEVLDKLVCMGAGIASLSDAVDALRTSTVISTDPPYYDNVPYADLSDFFYAWSRGMLRDALPELFSTVQTPKADELVADYVRHGGKSEARTFFEARFEEFFTHARTVATLDFPAAVYYAFKQVESDGSADTVSAGWETLLDGVIRSGWSITATWPMRSELGSRMRSIGSNALASSVVLALRPRSSDASTTDRRGLIAALHAELPDALRDLQQSQIAPVDLPQAAIGPGMAVFSRYARVVEADGSTMTVRSALSRINEILDEVLAEQEGDFDSVSRFAISWYRQTGYGSGSFGTAEDLARARNTSVDLMDRHGILLSRAGKVKLIKPADLPADHDPVADTHASNWEGLHHLVRLLESDGISAAGSFLAATAARSDGAIDAELVKELAFLLFSIAEKNGWTKDALSFNALAQAWPDIISASRERKSASASQGAFEFDEGGDD